MVFQQLTPQELGAILLIGVLLGVLRYMRYDVGGGRPSIDIVFSIALAFVAATVGLLVAKRLGWIPASTPQN